MGALARRLGRHRSRLAGAAAVALAAGALAAPAEAARTTKVAWEGGGGLAGLSGSLTVYRDHTGRATDNDKHADFALTNGEWSKLERRLKASRFGTLKRRYAPEMTIPDSTYDVIRYRGRSVTVHTGGQPPARLQRLLSYLWKLHERHQPSR